MKLLVTGAAGMLGADVARAARAAGHEVVALARAELDVTDPAAVRERIRAEAPGAVVNCAAWTDVDGAEADETGALAVNGAGAGHVAEAAGGTGAFLVHVSTDYVFDGRAERPYVESDPTGPLSAYGRTKLAGERAVAAAGERHAIARTAWLFGRNGPNFVETMLRLARERGAVRVVDDQIGCPTFTGHLAAALVRLAEDERAGIHHLAGEGRCSWHEFAAEIFSRAGVEVDLAPCTTEEMPRPAPRPRWSVLGTERPDALRLPPWREGLASYLRERAAEEVTA